ncbi:MAG: M67 family metallopeptidase [Chromatiales bacterium]|nr:M67 family metallopeptidase [Gammaproteobacteria bacterium]MBW6475692.1 M67 family metallopeptidase [Chromatiales bacterium]
MNSCQIPRSLVNQLLRHAQQAPEREVCGLIGARDGQPQSVYPAANLADEPEHLFAMDPAAQIAAMRQMREQGEALFAIYHSHPHAPAEPSLRDVQQAAYPEALYLIISLNTKGVLELRAFRLVGQTIESVELYVAEV